MKFRIQTKAGSAVVLSIANALPLLIEVISEHEKESISKHV